MQGLVRSLVCSELPDLAEQDANALFLRIFQQLSSAPGGGAAEDAAVEELIAQHLRGLRKSDRGLDRHLRFQGLKNRLPSESRGNRSSVLALLFLLRGDPYAGETRSPQYFTHRGRSEPKESGASKASDPTVRTVYMGWQLSAGAGGPPTELPEAKLVRDLLFALQGVSSDCFKLNGSFEVDPAVILSRPAWVVSQKVLELATLHARLSNQASAEGLLQQALCEALRQQLQDYYEMLALLMSRKLTLRSLWSWLLAPRARLGFLATLSEATRQGVFGGAVASTVVAFAQSGDLEVQKAATRILASVVRPLLAMIRAWMTEGELQDPFGEFFVVAASVPLQDLWTRMYRLELEMVPSFLSLDLARKILLTGKSVNFIRLCCPGQVWSSAGKEATTDFDLTEIQEPQEGQEGPASSGLLRGLAERVESAAQRTNEHLVRLLMDKYALGEHALALRRFLLLGQGDFVESLMDALQEELNAEADTIHRHHLMGFLDMALRQSNAQFCPADVLARLGVKLLSPSAGERGWDVFLLDYSIDAPLHVVFTPAAMQKYERTFAFLWKLRRVSHALAASWSQHMTLQRHLSFLGKAAAAPATAFSVLHRFSCLRHQLQHFVQNIQSYVMFEVLDTSWAKLQAGWRSCTDLDEVISQHDRYLVSIEEGAFLAQGCESVLSGITTLLALALDFCHLHDQACAASFEAAEAMEEAEEEDVGSVFQVLRSQPFARSLAECRAQLDGVASSFSMKLQQLLQSLEEQPELRVLDFSFLCCRLDFNGYYERQADSPAGP